MANNDYFVIVFKFLSLLYQDLKDGKKTDLCKILANEEMFPITEVYWVSVIEDLLDKGYIKGIAISRAIGRNPRLVETKSGIQITGDGIEYLQDNGKMQQVMSFIKDFAPAVLGLLG